MDGLIDKYLPLLEVSKDRGKVLAMMYCEMFDTSLTVDHIKMFRRFTNLYGFQRVISTLLDISGMELEDKNNVYGLLSSILKRKVQTKVGSLPDDYLVDHVKEMEKKIKEQRRNIEQLF